MGIAASDYNSSDPFAPGTLLRRFRDQFQFGRTTVDTCSWNTGLMPNPVLGCSGLTTIFIEQLYKCQPNNWELTAAISGAHTLGQAKIANSGFNGFWSSAAEQGKFNNDYFRSILLKGWSSELAVNGVEGMN